MEDHNHGDQYGITDHLRHLIMINGGKPPTIPHLQPQELAHHHQHYCNDYDLMMMTMNSSSNCTAARGLAGIPSSSEFHSGASTSTISPPAHPPPPPPPPPPGFDQMEYSGTGRWPREETLTLLEVRSRLDSKFKEANQKAPLWDEVSRIMSEEHGYQRNGKKCREKFENLYKYYKKSKEGKSGRQDGKHYRFFRQLEALYGSSGETSSNINNHHPTTNNSIPVNIAPQTAVFIENSTPPTSTDLENTSTEISLDYNSGEKMAMMRSSRNNTRKSSGKKSWKKKIMEFIDSQMKKIMEKQEAWMEKVMKTIEQKEKERTERDSEWRKQEMGRIDREHSFWAKERAWIEARDAALTETLQNLSGKSGRDLNHDHDDHEGNYYKNSTTSTGQGGCYGEIIEHEEQLERVKIEQLMSNGSINDGGNVGQESTTTNCLRLLVDHDDQNHQTLWENYGLKLNNIGD